MEKRKKIIKLLLFWDRTEILLLKMVFFFWYPIFNKQADKIRKYRADYNNRPPSAVSFMPAIASTSDRLHSEFVRILFLQTHRETDRFFAASGVQIP